MARKIRSRKSRRSRKIRHSRKNRHSRKRTHSRKQSGGEAIIFTPKNFTHLINEFNELGPGFTRFQISDKNSDVVLISATSKREFLKKINEIIKNSEDNADIHWQNYQVEIN
jgi:hypothetical protein